MPAEAWIALIVVIAVCAVAALIWMWLRRRFSKRQEIADALLTPATADDPSSGRPHPWVIVNPSKHDDLDAFKKIVTDTAKDLGIDEVHWNETTAEDPGAGQAVEALAKGASIVIASGGDGTVRAVAAGLAGTGVRMGIIPAGTGNVLAGNLGLPIGDVAKATRIALGANHRGLDVGWLRVADVAEPSDMPAEGTLVLDARKKHGTDEGAAMEADEYAFVVIAGMGFDGETMANTDSDLKKKIGWLAYVLSGVASIATKPIKARLTLRSPESPQDHDGDKSGMLQGETSSSPSNEDEITWLTAKSIMFAICSDLQSLTLAYAAKPDDGLIDVIAVDTQAGVLGWADLSWKILGQGLGIKTVNLPTSVGKIAFRQAKGSSVTAETPQVVQVDGDALGLARTIHARIDHMAIDIAVPGVD
ncbi:diacylglycerol/lipid kinase family protein [Schaalia vaccimaxillae]|uniref:diacylglycerol/lipid kinase family protein n=1 Tax=Schaalia vaccimaxillae TaxID=183916 RepID=UPI0003B3153A|nr:diacylglycerol kinase family protein [Schaalia vaccimaxillae]